MEKRKNNWKRTLAAGLIVACLSIGTGQVLAGENEQEETEEQILIETEDSTDVENTDENQEEEQDDERNEEGEPVGEEVKDEAEAENEEAVEKLEYAQDEQEQSESPSLLPGNFFYFFKTLKENVQLALTFNGAKEAELIASFVEERIKEAEALIANGEVELAEEILQRAINQQEEALAAYEKVTEEASETGTETANEESPLRSIFEEKLKHEYFDAYGSSRKNGDGRKASCRRNFSSNI